MPRDDGRHFWEWAAETTKAAEPPKGPGGEIELVRIPYRLRLAEHRVQCRLYLRHLPTRHTSGRAPVPEKMYGKPAEHHAKHNRYKRPRLKQIPRR